MSSEITNKKITDWMDVFSAIYKEPDADRTPEQIWIAIMAHASKIGESIRTFSIKTLSISAAHTFCWLCSFINKCNTLEQDIFALKEDLSSIVTLKYPNVCGHCGESTCHCDAIKMDREKDKSAAYADLLNRRVRLSYKDYTMDNFLRMFNDIYEGRIHIQTLESIGFHFLEEAGEAAFAVRKLSQLQKIHSEGLDGIDLSLYDRLTTVESIVDEYSKIYEIVNSLKDNPVRLKSTDPRVLKARVIDAKLELIVEIGDTFSWFCAIINKLNMIEHSIWEKPEEHINEMFQNFEITLNEEYIKDGEPKCPTCTNVPCQCAFFNRGIT